MSFFKRFFGGAAIEVGQVPVVAPAAPPSGDTGNILVRLSGSFAAKPVKVWLSGSWVVKPLKFWTGSSWETTPH